MDIIEKLGIEPGFYISEGKLNQDSEAIYVESDEIKQIKNTAPDMLECLIDGLLLIEYLFPMLEVDSNYFSFYMDARDSIEKATGKTWSEIKDLI